MTSDQVTTTSSRTAGTIVGVGASAGGLEALEKLLSGVRPDGICAYVIVTHLSPDFKSLLDELLQRHTQMAVRVVEDGIQIAADVIYILPPNTEMIVVGGRLHLNDRNPDAVQALPINIFFSSLAREYGSRAVGVILSGSGSDGAKGVEEIRRNGGIVIVQTPETARFDSMPRAAINSGEATVILDPVKMGEAILAHTSGLSIVEGNADEETLQLDERSQSLTEILQIVYARNNIDFTLYKITTVYRRIRRRMLMRGHDTLPDYVRELKENAAEIDKLTDEIFITVTEFFRDKEAFEFLAQEIIPEMVRRAQPGMPIRLWSAACSSGQEAYSLAILLYMEARKQQKRLEPQIYATDIREESVQRAGAGIFQGRDLDHLPAEIVDTCFERISSDEYCIIQPIRRWIVFAKHDLLRDPPFTRLDFISCRNVLIYFEPEAQKKSLALFNFGLRENGVLFLGRSESLGDLGDDFQTISKRWRLYRKTGVAAAVRLSISNRLSVVEARSSPGERFLSGNASAMTQKPRLGPAYAALMDSFIPDGVLINGKGEVLHIFGDAGLLFNAPRGAMVPDILRMAPAAMRVPLAAALDRARTEDRDIMFMRIPAVGMEDRTEVSIRVTPLPAYAAGDLRYFFIGFDKPLLNESEAKVPAIILDPAMLESDRVASLERDLDYTRENLQATIEEVETSNEELQSTNEELMASNEELQSTNEELQSVNEELYTVNAEYQNKNEELHEITRDLDNLMSSTAIGVVFVDEELLIRRYTEAITQIMSITPVDVGRALPDITHKLIGTDISGLIRHALSTREVTMVTARSLENTWWEVRVIPLVALKGRGDGAVVTFYDVSDLKSVQQSNDQRMEDLQFVAEMTGARVIHQSLSGEFMTPQEGWSTLSGQKEELSLGFGWIDATHPDNWERLRSYWTNAEAAPETSLQTHVRVRPPGEKEYRHVTLISRPDTDDDGVAQGWITVLIDVEDSVQSVDVVRETEQILGSVLSVIPSRISYVDRESRYRYVNQAYERSFGKSCEEIVGKPVEEILPGPIFAQAMPYIEKALAGESSEFTIRAFSATGEEEVLHVHYEPHFDLKDEVLGFAVSVNDIAKSTTLTEENMREQALITHTLLKSSIGLMTVAGPGSKIKFSSDNITALTGFSALALKRKSLPDLLPEYDKERLANLIAQNNRTDRDSLSFDTFLINRVGDSVEVEVEIVQSGSGAASMLIVMLRDRRASSAAEAALRRRTEELSRSNRMLEIFAVAATHELTSPLRRVAKFSQLLREDYTDVLDSEGREVLDTILDETARMRRTITSVIELARLDGSNLNFADTSLEDLVASSCVDIHDQIKASEAEMTVEGDCPVLGDPNQLRILFRNILANAIAYSAPGRNPQIHISTKTTPTGQVQIAIRDNGRGVPQDRHSDIFLPFVRFKGNENSIGMGLALSQRIAETHGGQLVIADSTSEGSTFVLNLPARDTAAA